MPEPSKPGVRIAALVAGEVVGRAWTPGNDPSTPYVTVRFAAASGKRRVVDIPLDGSVLVLPASLTPALLRSMAEDAVIAAQQVGDEEKERAYLAVLSALEGQEATP
jgi:hypothetical protein